jgi:hypothetical protein
MVTHPNRSKKSAETPVLVTTAHKGVFFGYATETDGESIELRAARNCIFWGDRQQGLSWASPTWGRLRARESGRPPTFDLRDVTSWRASAPTMR